MKPLEMTGDDLIRMNKVLRHRLRNSSSGLKSSIAFLSRELEPVLTPSLKEYFPLIINECDAITHITNRMHSIIDDLAASPSAPVGMIVQSVLTKLEATWPTQTVEVDVTDPAVFDVHVLQADALSVPLQEVLVNAFEAAMRKPCGLHLGINEGRLTVRVTDEGSSLKEDVLCEQLFLPYYTTKTRHLGLGLTIARRYAQTIGGTVQVERAESTGVVAELVFSAAEGNDMMYGVMAE
ncbi:MAG: HAMP domain-containing histidine kinase [Spartobacteria bacterium]|nr:HAMP domain-containing histidine kinase [Spartobacteria bacterium]